MGGILYVRWVHSGILNTLIQALRARGFALSLVNLACIFIAHWVSISAGIMTPQLDQPSISTQTPRW